MTELILKNQFGEQSNNSVVGSLQAVSDAAPAKTGVEAVAAIATPASATAEINANKINEILAALKVVS